MNLPCLECAAPVPVWEYAPHLAACVKIKLGTMPTLPGITTGETLGAYCYRIHCEDQAQKHLRVGTTPPITTTNTTNPEPPPADPHGHWASWKERQGQGTPPPVGKVQCFSCKGLSHMYPYCHACDGRGWL